MILMREMGQKALKKMWSPVKTMQMLKFGMKSSFRKLLLSHQNFKTHFQKWILKSRVGLGVSTANKSNHFIYVFIFFWNRQQAKLFEERMSNVFGGVEGAPSGDQINLTFQKMAGMI